VVLPAWRWLTQDQEIWSFVEGYKIPFVHQPPKERIPVQPKINQQQNLLINQEVEDLLNKEAMSQAFPEEGEFLSNLFLVPKKDGGQRPVKLNKFVPYQHFKMEGFYCLRYMLEVADYTCKIDLKDAYFSVPLHSSSKKFVKFQWSGNLYEFTCLCFELGPASRIFTNLLKTPISLLRRLNIYTSTIC